MAMKKLLLTSINGIVFIAGIARGAGLMLLLAGVGYIFLGESGIGPGFVIGLGITIIAVVISVIGEALGWGDESFEEIYEREKNNK